MPEGDFSQHFTRRDRSQCRWFDVGCHFVRDGLARIVCPDRHGPGASFGVESSLPPDIAGFFSCPENQRIEFPTRRFPDELGVLERLVGKVAARRPARRFLALFQRVSNEFCFVKEFLSVAKHTPRQSRADSDCNIELKPPCYSISSGVFSVYFPQTQHTESSFRRNVHAMICCWEFSANIETRNRDSMPLHSS